MDSRHPEMEPTIALVQETPILRKWTSRQFLVTLIGMGLVFAATWGGKEVTPLSTVVIVAITGAAGINYAERKR